MPFYTAAYYINPKTIANYKKSFMNLNRITINPYRGSQFLTLQRLIHHRLHLAKCLSQRKICMFQVSSSSLMSFRCLMKRSRLFQYLHITATSILTNFPSTEEIFDMPIESLIHHTCGNGCSRFAAPPKTAFLLQQAVRKFVRLNYGLLAKHQFCSQSKAN